MTRTLILLICAFALSANAAEKTTQAWSLNHAEGHRVDFDPATMERPTVLLFWATWCPYCRKLMPEIQRLREAHSEDALAIYAINIWEDGDPVAHLKELGHSYDLLLDGDDVAEGYGVKGTPGLMVVAPGGEVIYSRKSGTEPAAVHAQVVASLKQLSEAP